MPTYDIHYRRDYSTTKDYVLIARGFRTLEDARAARQAAGDLVVFHNTTIVVNEPDWLWDWEKRLSPCYAHHAMVTGMTLAEFERYLQVLGYHQRQPARPGGC